MGKNDKSKQPERTPQDNEQIQTTLASYNQLAANLAKSRTEEQIEQTLSPIFDMSEAAQVGLLKALAKERSIAAADLVLAVNTYAPIKEVRKEARRSLIQLEASNTYPEWTIPSVMSLSDILGVDTLSDFEGDDEDYDEDDDEEETLDGETTIRRFLNYWGQGDFELACDLLAPNSPLREGLSPEEWAGRRVVWREEAKATSIKLDVGYSLEVGTEDEANDLEDDVEELEAFWSLEMKNGSSTTLPELPTATLVLEATGRHWFWASYSLVAHDGELRILNIRDRGAEALQLPQQEIEAHIQEIAEEIHAMSEALDEDDDDETEIEDDELDDEDDDELDSDDEDESDEDELELDLDEVRWFTKQSLHYCDALIKHAPQEAMLYELATKQAMVIEDAERSAAYLTLAAEHVSAERADILRTLGETYTVLSAEDTLAHQELEEALENDEDAVAAEFTSRYFPLAEQVFKDAIALDNAFSSYILLADLYIRENKKFDEAKALFEQAETLAENPNQQAAVALGRAQLAQHEKKLEEALALYRQALDLAPDIPTVWNSIGEIQLSLDQQEAAEKSFLKSIEVNPTVVEAYGQLATLYVERNSDAEAIPVLEQGIEANPDAVELMASLAMLYLNQNDLQKAEELIAEAEVIDPGMELVYVVRQVIDMTKLQMQQQRSSNSKSNKSKKKR